MQFTQILNQDLEQGKLMAAVVLGNKGQKNASSNRLTFGKIFRKDVYCVRNCKKIDIGNYFYHSSSTLKLMVNT